MSRLPSFQFAIVAGLLMALFVALGVTGYEWLTNPGDIYRDAQGTHWRFVMDTAISWFVPVFLGASVAVWLGLYLWRSIRRSLNEGR